MSEALDLFYWDACIFYEHLKDEPVEPVKKQAIEQLLVDNEAKRNRICTSVITHTEILPKKLVEAEAEADYWGLFGSTYFYDIAIDRSVILLSRKIRDFYFEPPKGEAAAKVMSTPDSIHLATAIIHEAPVFHTRDGKRKGGNVPLIGLEGRSPAGKICGEYALRIISPVVDQPRFEGT